MLALVISVAILLHAFAPSGVHQSQRSQTETSADASGLKASELTSNPSGQKTADVTVASAATHIKIVCFKHSGSVQQC